MTMRIRVHWIRLLAMVLFLPHVTLVAAQAPMSQAAGGFEALPHFEASAILPGDLLQGPNHRVEPRVDNDGYYYHYRITSPVGTFAAISTRMLGIRVAEINALVTLKKANDAAILAGGAVDAFGDLFTGAVSTVTNPVQTVEGIPGGLNRLFGFAGREVNRAEEKIEANQAAPSGQGTSTLGMVGQGSETVARGVLGVNAAERRWAQKLGVDPYTTNPVLSERLTDVAWVAFSGRAGIQALFFFLVPYSGAMTAVSATNRAVWDTPAGDLVNMAEAKFRETGATPDQVRALMGNPQYSLSSLWSLALAFDRLKDVPGRDQVVEFAAVPETQDEVKFVVGAVNMLARYHEAVARIARVSAPGPIKGETAAGAIVLPAPVDYISWTDTLGRVVPMQDFQAPEKILFLSGQVSPLARKNLVSRGWTINESYTWGAEQ